MDTLIHVPTFIENDKAIFDAPLSNVPWTKINYFKRHVSHYEGGIAEIDSIIDIIQLYFQREVTGAFLNYYEDGNEFAPYHSDKYECDSCIVSLGTTRILRYKHNSNGENTDFTLKSGDLLFIPDEINNNYKHSLLKRTKINEPRISILFFLSDRT